MQARSETRVLNTHHALRRVAHVNRLRERVLPKLALVDVHFAVHERHDDLYSKPEKDPERLEARFSSAAGDDNSCNRISKADRQRSSRIAGVDSKDVQFKAAEADNSPVSASRSRRRRCAGRCASAAEPRTGRRPVSNDDRISNVD
jgi:hypothetical protein